MESMVLCLLSSTKTILENYLGETDSVTTLRMCCPCAKIPQSNRHEDPHWKLNPHQHCGFERVAVIPNIQL